MERSLLESIALVSCVRFQLEAFRVRKRAPIIFPLGLVVRPKCQCGTAIRSKSLANSCNLRPRIARPWPVTTTSGSSAASLCTEDFAALQSGVKDFGGPCISSACTATA